MCSCFSAEADHLHWQHTVFYSNMNQCVRNHWRARGGKEQSKEVINSSHPNEHNYGCKWVISYFYSKETAVMKYVLLSPSWCEKVDNRHLMSQKPKLNTAKRPRSQIQKISEAEAWWTHTHTHTHTIRYILHCCCCVFYSVNHCNTLFYIIYKTERLKRYRSNTCLYISILNYYNKINQKM